MLPAHLRFWSPAMPAARTHALVASLFFSFFRGRRIHSQLPSYIPPPPTTPPLSSFFLLSALACTGGVRRRATGGGSSGGGGVARTGGNSNGMSMLRYYTDDAPGLKITPVRLPLTHMIAFYPPFPPTPFFFPRWIRLSKKVDTRAIVRTV